MSSETMLTASCVWTCDEDGNWDTACGGMFILLADTPKQNGMNFCCYCGRALTEADDAYRLDMTAQGGGGNAPE